MGLATWRDYAGIWKGQTVWVVAGGATSRYVAPGFFDGKPVVAVNYAAEALGLTRFHTVTNHWNDAARIATDYPGCPVITSEREQMPEEWQSGLCAEELPETVLRVPTVDQPYGFYDVAQHWPSDGRFTLGPTSLHLAMHWAVHLGAAHLVIVGADCGAIDGDHHVPGYVGNLNGEPTHLHFGLWRRTLEQIAAKLRADGIGVHSLNPWVTPALEGHRYDTDGLTING